MHKGPEAPGRSLAYSRSSKASVAREKEEGLRGARGQITRGLAGPGKKFELHFRCSGKEALVTLKLGTGILSLNFNAYLNLSN